MNREQAREIAENVQWRWDGVHDEPLHKKIADALHAAFEEERQRSDASALHRRLLASEADGNAARLASIKETARRIWAGCVSVPDPREAHLPIRVYYTERGWEANLAADCNAAVRFAEALENAFERRYGGGR